MVEPPPSSTAGILVSPSLTTDSSSFRSSPWNDATNDACRSPGGVLVQWSLLDTEARRQAVFTTVLGMVVVSMVPVMPVARACILESPSSTAGILASSQTAGILASPSLTTDSSSFRSSSWNDATNDACRSLGGVLVQWSLLDTEMRNTGVAAIELATVAEARA